MDVAQFGDTELSLNRLKSSVEKLRQRDNGQTKTRMEEEFDVCNDALLIDFCFLFLFISNLIVTSLHRKYVL